MLSCEPSSPLWEKVAQANGNGMIWFLPNHEQNSHKKRLNVNRKLLKTLIAPHRTNLAGDSIIFELIKGEMAYVRDLENIETVGGICLLILCVSLILDI